MLTVAGLCGLVTFAMCVIGVEMMMEVMVNGLLVQLFIFPGSCPSLFHLETSKLFLLLCSFVISFYGARELWSTTRICACPS